MAPVRGSTAMAAGRGGVRVTRDRLFVAQRVVRYVRHPECLQLDLVAGTVERATVEVRVYAPGVFRVTMRYGDAPVEATGIVRASPLTDWSLVESEGELWVQAARYALRIRLDRWHLELVNEEGRVLAETLEDDVTLTGSLYSPGTGVEVRAEDLGTAWDMRWDPQRAYLTWRLRPGEHVWGGGEKFTALDRRGQRLTMWNTDALGVRSETSYKNVPFYLSSNGYGLYVDSARRVVFDFGQRSTRAITVEVPGGALDAYLIAGGNPAEILSAFTALTSRPPVPPKWSFGLWISTGFDRLDRAKAEAEVAKIREQGIPCDVYHFDCFWLRDFHWCDLTWDTSRFPEPAEMLRRIKELGFRICVWINPYVSVHSEMFREGVERKYFALRPDGRPYVANLWLDMQPAMGIVDFTNPQAVAWFQSKLETLMDMGVDTFKTDFGEDIPEDAVFSDGRTGRDIHNLYALLYQRAVFETIERRSGRAIIWARAACAGCQAYPTHWSGDPACTFDDMAAVLRAGLSNSASGFAYWSHDIGGFKGIPTPELYVRWAQFGLLSPHARCHSQTPRFPWDFGERVLAIFRDYARLRYRLGPYIYSYAHLAARTGLPLVRPMFLEFPDDPTCAPLDRQYMFGRELLVAPVLDPKGEVQFYLPRGKWVHLLTGDLLEGGRWVKQTLPLEQIPIYLRENGMVPMGPVVNQLSEQRLDDLEVHALVVSSASFQLQDDDVGLTLRAERSEHALTFSAESDRGEWRGSWRLRFHDVGQAPRNVSAGGVDLPYRSETERSTGVPGWWMEAGQLVVQFAGARCEVLFG